MMKTTLLRLFGAAVSTRLGFTLLQRYAFRTPARHIHDLDGALYMGRWRVVDEGTLGSRILCALTGYSAVRLHRIMRGDHDRDTHNHPFAYRTFVLSGWYSEQVQRGLHGQRVMQTSAEGDTVYSSRSCYHRIAHVSYLGVWTLFFMTRNRDEWGFNVEGRYVPSTTYLLRKGFVDGGKR